MAEDSAAVKQPVSLPKLGLHAQVCELEALITETLRTSRKEAETLRTARSQRQPKALISAKRLEALKKLKEDVNDYIEGKKSAALRFFDQQAVDNEKLRNEINLLRDDNTSLQQSVVKLQRRLREVELDLGE
ncbi:hypothetical protein FOZ60_016276 [Perkinsus olseni]|uniref:Uncharacterized protein n=1 Tax=Perkinsus olseni TaxID=32597 RepID=A0A7J6P4G7_PEROL|nr:hypothetical protein FOZ60_016276 [Perkinsus olseni]